jgi:hypothetical protein
MGGNPFIVKHNGAISYLSLALSALWVKSSSVWAAECALDRNNSQENAVFI